MRRESELHCNGLAYLQLGNGNTPVHLTPHSHFRQTRIEETLFIPSYLTGKFIQRSKIHGRNTRCRGELDLPICRLKIGQRSFAFRGAKLYNNLPNDIEKTLDVKKFKAKVCNYLLNL